MKKKKLINLLKAIVIEADRTKINEMVDIITFKKIQCKEIKLNFEIGIFEELKLMIKELEDEKTSLS